MVNSFSLFLAPILLASTLVPSTLTKRESTSTITTIPLQRRSEQVWDIDTLYAHVEHLKVKHDLGEAASSGLKKREALLLNNIKDSHFSGQILVGTPPQKFDVILDTGSRDLVLVNTLCTNCLPTTPLYNATSSSTSKVTSTANVITYGTSQAIGVLASDTVSIAGTSYTAQAFTSCSTLFGSTISSGASGLLGLGLGLSAGAKVYGVVQSLAREGLLHEPVFGFAFESLASINSSTTQPKNGSPVGGVMTLGGTNTSLYTGAISWQYVTSSTSLWEVPMQGVVVGGKKVPGVAGAFVVIDTGASVIAGPAAAVAAIYAQIPGSQPITYKGTSGLYSYPCNSTINFGLTFGNTTFTIPDGSLSLATSDDDPNSCLGAIISLQDTVTGSAGTASGVSTISWIIGDVFLINVYSAFRFQESTFPSVGFAIRGSGGIPSPSANFTFVPRAAASTIQVKLFNPSWIAALGLAVVLVAV